MAYQSEAQLEKQFIEQLQEQDYQVVNIPDYDALLANFRIQCEKYNKTKLVTPLSDKEWERILNYLNGRGIFDSAKVLRDKYVLERDDGSKVYIAFLDEDHTKNTYQVTNQTTVQGKYDIVNIGLHFFHKDVRPYAASCSEVLYCCRLTIGGSPPLAEQILRLFQ